MDNHIERLLNRISLCFAAIATFFLFQLFAGSSFYCSPTPFQHRNQSLPLTLAFPPFPNSSCETASREVTPPEKRFLKLRSTRAFQRRVQSFMSVFLTLRSLDLLSNSSHVLCVSAGAGHEVVALLDSGVVDVNGVEIVEFLPLIKRADPHNLPFFDGVFDLGFSTGFSTALFPRRFVEEIERTVRNSGVIVLAVDRRVADDGVENIEKLFKVSRMAQVRNFTLDGSPMSLIVMRKNNNRTNQY